VNIHFGISYQEDVVRHLGAILCKQYITQEANRG
jgi:hypothetical protein